MEAVEILVEAARVDDRAVPLADLAEAVFRGPLAVGGSEVREGQIRMAREVADAIEGGPASRLAVEAPTGSGKSLALLVPAVLAILRREAADGGSARVILSTAGIPLQRQIVGKDVPALSRALEIDLSAAVVKGRSNYACRDRLAVLADGASLESDEARRVSRWIEEGGSGDREDLPWKLQRWGSLSVAGEECLGAGCGFAGTCIASRFLHSAATARIVVMNHAYLALAGGKWLAEGAVALIVDEAHELEEALRNAQSGEVTAGQADHWRRDFERAIDGAELAPEEVPEGTFEDPEEDESAEDGSHVIPLFAPPAPPSVEEIEALWADDDFPPAAVRTGLAGVADGIAAAIRSVTDAADEEAGSRDVVRLREGWWTGEGRPGAALADAAALLDRLERLDPAHDARVNRCMKGLRKLAARLNHAAEVPEGYAVWTERERGKRRICVAPIEVKLPDRAVATVLCSATLGAGRPAEAARAIGIEARELVLPHPWPVDKMGVCFVPKGPSPKDPRWAEWCDRGAVWFARQCGGGVLVLASSWARAEALAAALRVEVPWRVRLQGEAGRTELIDWFREDEDGILVGTASFRQGLDVAGRACRGVIIDRIPFPSPGDPLEEAIAERFRDGFRERAIPVAAQALRQSAGRLLRTVSDRGAICVLDPRLAEESWARRLREAVGPIPVTRDPKDVRRVLAGDLPEGVIVEKPRKAARTRSARS